MTINVYEPITYEGGCHCGAVRFRVIVDKHNADDCNCSICKKKCFLHLIMPPERFILLQGAEELTTYKFNTGVAEHTFCRICGIHAFYRPRCLRRFALRPSHPNSIDVNIRCLDGDVLSQFEVVPFDGANWEQNIHKLHQ